jgi:tRNA(His) guanylyltransferase
LKDTVSAQKNEIMFQKGLNYNNEPDIYKKGTILLWTEEIIENKKKPKMNLEELHEDLI